MNTELDYSRHENMNEIFLLDRKRRFSLEDNFMNYSVDDILFGAMYYLATFHPTKRVFYLTKKKFTQNKNIIKKACDVSTQTLNNHLKKLLEHGLIQEQEIKSGGVAYPSYTFSYKYKEKYQLIDNEMLWYIVTTRSQQAIKLYIYLLDKYNWKKSNGENYIFTNTELLKAIGYSTNSSNQKASSVVNNILESYLREGVIKYETFYEEIILPNGKTVPSPRKRLTFVAVSKQELPKI